MKTMHHRPIRFSSLGVLGFAVFLGVVVTTLAQAEGYRLEPRGLNGTGFALGSNELGRSPGSAPRNAWLLGTFGEVSARISTTDRLSTELELTYMPTGLRLTVGGGQPMSTRAWPLTRRDPALLSDMESENDRLSEPLFFMSIGQSW